MTDLPRRLKGDEFVAWFERLTAKGQDEETYRIAERHLSPITKPANIALTAQGIKLALLGEPLPTPRCEPRWRNGYVMGLAIRDERILP